MNPHPLIRGLAPQASASTYSATRASGFGQSIVLHWPKTTGKTLHMDFENAKTRGPLYVTWMACQLPRVSCWL